MTDITQSSKRRPKDGPVSVYATHLAGLLSGDRECAYSVWFRSHFWYDALKDGGTFDREGWIADHTAMLKARGDSYKPSEGTTITTTLESQNKFDVIGKVGKISGKIDLVVQEARQLDGAVTRVRIEDCKTGKRRPADPMQVLIYVYAWLKKHPEHLGVVQGAVVYKDGAVPVEVSLLTPERVKEIGRIMAEVCAVEPPKAAPSSRECNLCDIGEQYCPSRFKASSSTEGTATDDF